MTRYAWGQANIDFENSTDCTEKYADLIVDGEIWLPDPLSDETGCDFADTETLEYRIVHAEVVDDDVIRVIKKATKSLEIVFMSYKELEARLKMIEERKQNA